MDFMSVYENSSRGPDFGKNPSKKSGNHNFAAPAQNSNMLYNDTRWTQVISNYANVKSVAINIDSNQAAIAVSGCRFKISSYGWNSLVVGAFLDFGPMPDDFHRLSELQKSTLIDKILKESNTRQIVSKEFTPLEYAAQSQAVINLIGQTPESFNEQITSRARNDIRRAIKFDISIDFGHKFLNEFYELYLKKMYEFGTPPHRLEFFKEIIAFFGNDAQIGVALYGEKVISSSFDIVVGKNAFHLFACTDAKFKSFSSGDLLLLREIERCIQMQCESFWLGRSQRNSGVELYKSKWNPDFYGLGDFVWRRNEAVVQLNQKTSRQNTSRFFQHLSEPMFGRVGRGFRRFIP
jgi:hypothetical protein